jgi:hypothetical protein
VEAKQFALAYRMIHRGPPLLRLVDVHGADPAGQQHLFRLGNLAGFDAALASKQELPCAFT